MIRNTRYLATLIIGLALMLLSIFEMSAQNTSPLCFTARNGSVTVTFNIQNVTHTIQYSTNGTTWSTYTSGTGITLNADSSIYFRAETDQTTATAFGNQAYSSSLSSQFLFTTINGGTVEASGNIMSLYGPSCPNLALSDHAFRHLFEYCTLLTTAPDLPATTLAYSCYSSMFRGCTSLTTAPDLPATTLANYCYSLMFFGCTSLTTAPDLPATTLANKCYLSMFNGCTSLTTAPDLPATTLADMCYSAMFEGCTSLTTAPDLPATTLADFCYIYMFEGCTSLTTAPDLPVTTLTYQCYNSMFKGCTALTTVPDLPATTLTIWCYKSMFDSCTSLKINTTPPGKPWIIPADSIATDALTNMLSNTAGTMNGTPYANTTYYITNIPRISSLVTTAVNDTTMGSATGYDVYKNGTTATLTATPKPCHRFVNWSNGATTSTINIIVVSDTTLTANFEPIPPDSTALYETVCQGRLFSGYGIQDILINQDTTITIISKTIENCDSITCIHITCLPTTRSYTYIVITEGETLFGKTYTAGDYYDTLTNANGCDSIITLHIDVVGGTDVDNADDIVISIIPNSVNIGEAATIYGDFGDVKSIEITNNFGQVLTTFRPSNYPITIPAISTPGIYYIRIITADGRRYLTKLVVI